MRHWRKQNEVVFWHPALGNPRPGWVPNSGGTADDLKLASQRLGETASALLADPAADAATRLNVLKITAISDSAYAVFANPDLLAYALAWCHDDSPLPPASLNAAAAVIRALAGFDSLTPEAAAGIVSHTIPRFLTAVAAKAGGDRTKEVRNSAHYA